VSQAAHGGVRLTASVQAAIRELADRVPAAAIVERLLHLHPEYGRGKAPAALARLAAGHWEQQKPVAEWLDDVRGVFKREHVPELHGRLVIIGLARVDGQLREALEHDGFLNDVAGEISEPLEYLLAGADGDGAAALAARVPVHTDHPATVDELNREWFAKVLAKRIRYIRARELEDAETARRDKRQDPDAPRGRSFLVHLHGHWGVGKTSLLNFLKRELAKPDREYGDPCVVVTFNAWRHQRTPPPWWWLMVELYRQGARELWALGWRHWWRAIGFRAREWLWRAKGGWRGFVMLLAVALVLIALWSAGLFESLDRPETLSYELLQGLVIAVAAIVTPILTVWGVVRGVSRWVFTASARGARAFIENTRDPMQTVRAHFQDLVDWIGNPVVIIIDDLDRCRASYVIELLEGIQTLFRDSPVAYVVAADREWLAASYASEYQEFTGGADTPGRPLGYHFLEKTFQLSAGVPTMLETTRKEFWDRLLHASAPEHRAELQRARTEAHQIYAALQTEDAIREEIVHNPGSTPIEQQARLEAMAIHLATPKFERQTEHALENFAPLVDSNPRAMKRLVNAYGVALDVETLNKHNLVGDRREQRKTALWTILNLRWPRLGEYLARNPDDVGSVRTKQAPPRAPVDIQPLFADPDVRAVIDGAGVDVTLDAEDVRRRSYAP
jgi:hypothetical protein